MTESKPSEGRNFHNDRYSEDAVALLADRPLLEPTGGRKLRFYMNEPRLLTASEYPNKEAYNGEANSFKIILRLSQRGVIELPEIEATAISGEHLTSHYAIYMDTRLEPAVLTDIYDYLEEQNQWLDILSPEEVDSSEIIELVDQAIASVPDLGEKLEAIRQEDIKRLRARPPLDQAMEQFGDEFDGRDL